MDNKTLVEQFIKAVNEQDYDRYDELLADDFSIPPQTPKGLSRDALKNILKYYFTAFPDLNYEIKHLVSEGDDVMVHLKMRGTHKGDYQGHPGTRKSFEVDEVEIMQIANGKIAGYLIVWDETGFRRQLGLP
jgi:steroid delta-isomerase-like uncharacterized protein